MFPFELDHRDYDELYDISFEIPEWAKKRIKVKPTGSMIICRTPIDNSFRIDELFQRRSDFNFNRFKWDKNYLKSV